MSLLLPDGIERISECPFTLHNAILTALRILNYEEFPKDERPPKRIWLDADRLGEWWDEVDRKREEKFKIDGKRPAIDESSWEENALSLVTRG